MLEISFLALGLSVAILVIAFFLKKYQRAFLWIVALILFIGTCLSMGLGIIKIEENGVVNQIALCSVILAFGCSAIFACGAEKIHQALQKKANSMIEQSPNFPYKVPTGRGVVDSEGQQGDNEHVQLTSKLDTEQARKIFANALNAKLMEEVDGHYNWKESKTLLAYMCGRIYCEDKPKYDEREEKTYWKFGWTEFFPETELNTLFGVKALGQSRSNRKDQAVPQGSNKIDDLFK
jgi:hypothetical protein